MASTDQKNGNALEEAADPSTSPWRLAALADEADPDVRMAVAANPSASLLTVMRLRRDVDPRVRVVLSARDGTSVDVDAYRAGQSFTPGSPLSWPWPATDAPAGALEQRDR